MSGLPSPLKSATAMLVRRCRFVTMSLRVLYCGVAASANIEKRENRLKNIAYLSFKMRAPDSVSVAQRSNALIDGQYIFMDAMKAAECRSDNRSGAPFLATVSSLGWGGNAHTPLIQQLRTNPAAGIGQQSDGAGDRQAHDVEIAAFDSGNPAGGVALDGVGSSLVER